MGRKPLISLRSAASLTLIGAAAIVAGAAWIYFPVGLIVAGCLLVTAGLLSEVDG